LKILEGVLCSISNNQRADTLQRLGSTFVDGGIHPRFGTRNFTAPLAGGQYIEVVLPLDHPATEATPWGKAVSQKAQEGGGWGTCVFSTEDISPIEEKFGRKAVDGHRTRPDGTDLKWKQIGVKEIADSRELPFFIQWLTEDHLSKDGNAVAKIEKIVIADKDQLSDSWFKQEILGALRGVEIEWLNPENTNDENGLLGIELSTPSGRISLD
jgi:hypothetical protein